MQVFYHHKSHELQPITQVRQTVSSPGLRLIVCSPGAHHDGTGGAQDELDVNFFMQGRFSRVGRGNESIFMVGLKQVIWGDRVVSTEIFKGRRRSKWIGCKLSSYNGDFRRLARGTGGRGSQSIFMQGWSRQFEVAELLLYGQIKGLEWETKWTPGSPNKAELQDLESNLTYFYKQAIWGHIVDHARQICKA